MRTYYKVTVEAEVYDDEGGLVRVETLFAMSSPRAEALLRTAPTEVEDALRDLLPDEDEAAVNPEGRYRPVSEPVSAGTAPAPKTRKRRTKAEIEADKAAEAAHPAAEAPPVEAAQPAAEAPPVETAQPATTVVPAAAGAPGEAPWNPFQPR